MADTERVAPRREFMKTVGLSAAAIAVSAVTLRAGAEETETLAADEAWLTRLNGKHRQFFDAVSPNDGWGLVFANTFMNKNMEAYGLKPHEITTVVGLRHMAMPLALNSEMWSKYKVGQFINVMDKSTKAPATRNVYANVRPGDVFMDGASVDSILSRGGIVTACNVALTVLAGMAAGAAGLPPDGAAAEWRANLLPGVVVVPAGVLAVNRAQEHQCSYCFAG